MARAFCPACQRAANTCLCGDIEPINNPIAVVILQHPSEYQRAKNTAPIAQLALQQCQTWVGESFEQESRFQQLMATSPWLLFPHQTATCCSQANFGPGSQTVNQKPTLLIIDGTWRKARKIWHTNPSLQSLRHLTLPTTLQSHYTIRKTRQANSLSTVEAIAFALELLEQQPGKYQPLNQVLQTMVSRIAQFSGKA